MEIDLQATSLRDVPLPAYAYGVGEASESGGDDWLTCKRDESKFLGSGGPSKLEEIILHFVSWAGASGQQTPAGG